MKNSEVQMSNVYKLNKNNYQQWIGPSGKEFGTLKHIVRGSISDSCVPRKLGWEGEPTLCALQVPRQRLVIVNSGGNFVLISCNKKKS
jgi:hypothetical protein